MSSDKTEKISISMPGSLLAVIDEHLGETKDDRSGYLRKLVSADLAAAGKLPGTPAHDIRAQALKAAKIAGDKAVFDALEATIGDAYKKAGEAATTQAGELA